jgi:hypothetical protein
MDIKVIETGVPRKKKLAYPQWDRLEDSLQWIRDNGITTLGITKTFGWNNGTSLEFLWKNPWIEGIAIIEDSFDLTPINGLPNLNYISLSGNYYKGIIDLAYLENFTELRIGYNLQNFLNIDRIVSMQILELYSWPYETFEHIHKLENLEWLEIYRSPKLKGLSGLEKMRKLCSLSFKSVPNLTNIESLESIATSLMKLSFELARKVKDFTVLDKLHNLESFYIYESAPIHSIQFLKQLKNLKYAYIGTEVLDGDVAYLEAKGIEYKKLQKYKST